MSKQMIPIEELLADALVRKIKAQNVENLALVEAAQEETRKVMKGGGRGGDLTPCVVCGGVVNPLGVNAGVGYIPSNIVYLKHGGEILARAKVFHVCPLCDGFGVLDD